MKSTWRDTGYYTHSRAAKIYISTPGAFSDPQIYAKLVITAKPGGAPVAVEHFGAHTITPNSNTLEKDCRFAEQLHN